jgi:hypothetical protein
MEANGSEKAFCVLTFHECRSVTIVQRQFRTCRAPVSYVTKTWSVVLLNKKIHILLSQVYRYNKPAGCSTSVACRGRPQKQSQVYCVWQVVKTPTIILNNPVFLATISEWRRISVYASYKCLFYYSFSLGKNLVLWKSGPSGTTVNLRWMKEWMYEWINKRTTEELTLSISGKVNWQVKRKCAQMANCLGATLSTRSPTRIALEAKADLRAHKPTTSSTDLHQGLSKLLRSEGTKGKRNRNRKGWIIRYTRACRCELGCLNFEKDKQWNSSTAVLSYRKATGKQNHYEECDIWEHTAPILKTSVHLHTFITKTTSL